MADDVVAIQASPSRGLVRGHEIEGEYAPDYLAHIENALPQAADTGSGAASPEEESAPLANTMDSLRDSVYEMEASHPQLAGIVNRMLEVLARIGI